MERQRNMSQMKEQNKAPEKELNKMETIYQIQLQNTCYKDAQKLKGKMEELSGNFNKEIGNIKKK